MTADLFLKSLALAVAWREGAKNGANGMLGVLFALRNRVKDGWVGGTWFGVLQAALNRTPLEEVPDPRHPEFQQVMGLIDGIFDDTVPDTLTGGARYWAPVGDLVLHGVDQERTAVVGAMVFFR